MAGPVYALNLFNVTDRAEYLTYSRRSAQEVQAHGGRAVALRIGCPLSANSGHRQLHWMTSSARATSEGGTVRPSALAVLRLMTSSYFVGNSTGRSPGFSPLRMRAT